MGRTLVTGATGFLGRTVVAQLLAAGVAVRTTARRPRADLALPDFRPSDLTASDDLGPLLSNIDRVIHVAGLAHQFGRQAADNAAFQRVNALATERLARAAIAAGVRRFILVSSVAVYGSQHGEIDESTPCQPATAYGRSKWLAEQVLRNLVAGTCMETVILRPVTLYGEHDPGNVGRLMRTIDRGRF